MCVEHEPRIVSGGRRGKKVYCPPHVFCVCVWDGLLSIDAISDLFVLSDYLFKLLLIGDSGVGKSCLLLRFAVM